MAATQMLGTIFDGIARHTPEGYAFQQRAAETGFKQAVRERDEPFEAGWTDVRKSRRFRQAAPGDPMDR